MDNKKYRKQVISIIMLIVCTILTIILLIKLQRLNNSEEIIVHNGVDSSEGTLGESSKMVLKVDIRGSVNKPGVYEFIEGETIEDALQKAEGLSEAADMIYIDKNINRASKLIDEQKIYIPAKDENTRPNEEPSANGGSNLLDKININASGKDELMSLPGIGEAYADRIIESRPYKSIEEIKNVKGIGDSIYEKIKDKIKV